MSKPWKKRITEIEAWCVQNQMTPEDLDTTANTIKQVYTTQRRTTHPKYRINEGRHPQDFWRVVAMELKTRGYDIWQYINYCFNAYGCMLWPTMLYSSKLLNTFKEQDRTADIERAKEDIKINAERLVFEVKTTKQSIHDILSKPQNDFTEGFTWCIAKREGYTDLVNKHDKWARLYLFQSASQLAAYKEMFPEVF